MVIKIELKSDLCISSGEGYNSFLDIDVCYDKRGIPYIPAKRIKGCIREAGLELAEWGSYSFDDYERVFGTEGTASSKFTLSSAYIKNYSGIVRQLGSCENKELVHPQKVLSYYTMVRTQTALDEEGVAKRHHLRTMRVIRKGLVFEAECHLVSGCTIKETELFRQAVLSVKHMGLNRTRGLGRVELTLVDGQAVQGIESISAAESDDISNREQMYKLVYSIHLNSPLLCTHADGSSKSIDYIAGSKILGLLAQTLGKDEYFKLMNYSGEEPNQGQRTSGPGTSAEEEYNQEVIVSNAYISHSGRRYTPVRASLYQSKEKNFENGRMRVYDLIERQEISEPVKAISKRYMDIQENKGYVCSVEQKINYHHRRPSDKSLGIPKNSEDSAFYQLESICMGQTFQGYIIANSEKMKAIREALASQKHARIGNNRSAEYGDVEIKVVSVSSLHKKWQEEKEFIVKLNSPVILYNDQGMCTANTTDFIKCLEEVINRKGKKMDARAELSLIDQVVSYVTVGGFNTTWHRNKPTIPALGGGSIFRVLGNRMIDIGCLQDIHIGERVMEGYGEIEVIGADKAIVISEVLKPEAGSLVLKEKIPGGEDQQAENIIDYLKWRDTEKALIKDARLCAAELLKQWENKKELGTLIQRIILTLKSVDSFQKFSEQTEEMNESKKKVAKRMIQDYKEYLQTNEIDEMSVIYRERKEARLFELYFQTYLTQLKYLTRGGE